MITRKELKSIITKKPKTVLSIVKRDQELMSILSQLMTKFEIALNAAIFCHVFDYNPVCPITNITKKFGRYSTGFSFCGNRRECKCYYKSAKEKTKETNLKKYGYTNTFEVPAFKKKAKETNLKKYNVDNYSKTIECHLKMTETKLDRYGDPKYTNRDQAKQTNIDRYKNPYYSNPDKTKETKLDRYGDENYNNTDKAKETCRIRYGSMFDHTSQTHISPANLIKLKDKEWLIEQHHSNERTAADIGSELSVNGSTVLNYMHQFNIEIKNYNHSTAEGELTEHIITKFNTIIISNIRSLIKPREIDIWLPEYKIAIEYNGVYWHRPESYGGYHNWLTYHKSKEEECDAKGIKLLHLWENYDDHYKLIDQAIIDNTINNDYNAVYTALYNNKA